VSQCSDSLGSDSPGSTGEAHAGERLEAEVPVRLAGKKFELEVVDLAKDL